MALPQRGTGLRTGTARTTPGYGVPLTDAQRAARHSTLGAGNSSNVLLYILGGLALIMLLRKK